MAALFYSGANSGFNDYQAGMGATQRPLPRAAGDRQMDINSQSPAPGSEVSVIGEGIVINGNIEASVDLQIQGKVIGDVRCGTLLLGERSEIRGNVVAGRVRVAGTVEGSIETVDLAVEPSARITGDLSYTRIRIGNGAVVHGRITHVARDEAADTGGLRLVEPARALPQPVIHAQAQAKSGAKVQGGANAQQKPIYIE